MECTQTEISSEKLPVQEHINNTEKADISDISDSDASSIADISYSGSIVQGTGKVLKIHRQDPLKDKSEYSIEAKNGNLSPTIGKVTRH